MVGDEGRELYEYVYSDVLAHGGPVRLKLAGSPPGIACEPPLTALAPFTGLAERDIGAKGVTERVVAARSSNIAISSPAERREEESVMHHHT